MSRARRFQFIAVLIAFAILIGFGARWYFSTERRRAAWVHNAVTELNRLSADNASLAARAQALRPSTSQPTAPGFWLSDNLAVMRDGQWIVFKNECVHRDQFLGDIFIAKASNGHWYYSSYHFCCEMIVPRMEQDSQPADLASFAAKYFAHEFDGNPDSKEAIHPTWTPGSTPVR